MKIGKKLLLLNISLAVLSTTVLAAAVLNISHKRIHNQVEREIRYLADREARGIQSWLELYLDITRTVGQLIEENERHDPVNQREHYNLVLRSILMVNPEILAAWCCWEPNALDGRDSFYAGWPGSDSAGRFIPYWTRSGRGLKVDTLTNYDIPGKGDFNLVPLRTGREYLSDPYLYPVDGKDKMIISFSYPIRKDGRIAATIGIDVPIDQIQARVSAIKPYPGSAAAAYTGSGLIAGHFDPARIGKAIGETEHDIAGDHFAAFKAAVDRGSGVRFNSRFAGTDMIFTCVPFSPGRTETPWTVMVGIPRSIITAPLHRIVLTGVLIGVISVALFAVAAFIMAHSISKPLTFMSDAFKRLGTEDAQTFDIEKKRQLEKIKPSRDEIGSLAVSFDVMTEKLSLMSVSIDSAAHSIKQGRLRLRAGTAGLDGNYLRLIGKINATFDLFCAQFDAVPEALALFDGGRKMVYHNKAMETMLAAHGIDKNGSSVLPEILAAKAADAGVEAVFNPAIASPPPFTADISLGQGGERRWYSLTLMRPSESEPGEIASVLLLITDVTVLAQAKTAAETASRAKSDFLSRMSHEIRTPLNAITGLTRIAIDTHDVGKIHNCLSRVDSSSRHLLGVINDILDFSKIEAGKLSIEPEEFSLTDSLNFVASLMQGKASEKQIELKLTVQKLDNDVVYTDVLRLNQILINLISNAVKFSPEHSEVALTVREEMQSEEVSAFHFEVTDHGIGIDPRSAAKLFQPFEQSDGSITRTFGGTGLGLAISKSLVELMGGAIEMESEPGKGSTFRFNIVCHAREKTPDEHTQEKHECADEQDAYDFSGKRCLIVDDIDINREIIIELLGGTGMIIETASNGKEALDMFAASGEGYYDLILMDMQMPVMDGCTASKKIREFDRNDAARVPIIAMTANVLQEDVHKTQDAGMNAHLGKPIDIRVMYTVLNEHLYKKTA